MEKKLCNYRSGLIVHDLRGILWRMLRVSFGSVRIDENIVISKKIIVMFCAEIVLKYLDKTTNFKFMYDKQIETAVIWNFTTTYSKLEAFCIHFIAYGRILVYLLVFFKWDCCPWS